MLTAHLVPREAEEVLGVLGNDALEELAGPTAQGALGVGRRSAPSSEGAQHGVHRGGLARRR